MVNDRYLKKIPFEKGIALKNKLQLINSQSQRKYFRYRCGTGDFLAVAKRTVGKTVGVEPSDKARAID
jgi:hypothetical protein